MVTYLSLLDPEYAKTMVENFVEDALYVREDTLERIKETYTKQSDAILAEYESYTENAQRKADLNLAKDLSSAYYEAYESENKDNIISIKGRPFYITWSLFLDDDFRSLYTSDLNYDIFISMAIPCLA